MIDEKVVERLCIRPGEKFKLKDHPADWLPSPLRDLDEKVTKEKAEQLLQESIAEVADAQDVLYASDSYSVLCIFQAMDAAGKDGTIKHVTSGLHPQGIHIVSFKAPTAEELDHNYLWRCVKALPERGRIGIFNRSYYEEVLVVRVHPSLVEAQRIPETKIGDKFWKARFDDINALEKHLSRNGTVVLKFFLNVSKEEQKRRFLERIEDPAKHWKFSTRDVDERGHWDDYMAAFEEAINATSTKDAPWYVIPADRKWWMRTLVAEILARTIRGLKIEYPKLSPEGLAAMQKAKERLLAEK